MGNEHVTLLTREERVRATLLCPDCATKVVPRPITTLNVAWYYCRMCSLEWAEPLREIRQMAPHNDSSPTGCRWLRFKEQPDMSPSSWTQATCVRLNERREVIPRFECAGCRYWQSKDERPGDPASPLARP
jgi:hypothetical protein